MLSKSQSHSFLDGEAWRKAVFALAMTAALVLASPLAQAQTFQVLHSFTGGGDGSTPPAGLTMDQAGNFYGTASAGAQGGGTVFRLSKRGSGWIFTPLYAFPSTETNGWQPLEGVVIAANGTLYGTTFFGGGPGNGTVFNLAPGTSIPKSVFAGWAGTVLYNFLAGNDGAYPGGGGGGNLVLDRSGDIFGTTYYGGGVGCDGMGCGTVFELTPSEGGWQEKILYAFTGGSDGGGPAGLAIDGSGNLYGATLLGGAGNCQNPFGFGCGVIFKLTPSASGWTESVVHAFQDDGDGAQPIGAPILDESGNLYGTTSMIWEGMGQDSTAFQLTPSGNGWTFNLIWTFTEGGFGPNGALVMDVAGNLYGATPAGDGAVFELTRSSGGWQYTSLHHFVPGTDGSHPVGNVTFDANGNIYGTAMINGPNGHGTIWEITP